MKYYILEVTDGYPVSIFKIEDEEEIIALDYILKPIPEIQFESDCYDVTIKALRSFIIKEKREVIVEIEDDEMDGWELFDLDLHPCKYLQELLADYENQ